MVNLTRHGRAGRHRCRQLEAAWTQSGGTRTVHPGTADVLGNSCRVATLVPGPPGRAAAPGPKVPGAELEPALCAGEQRLHPGSVPGG